MGLEWLSIVENAKQYQDFGLSYFPELRPGEHLCSVFARFSLYTGLDAQQIQGYLFGSSAKSSAKFPGLSSFASRINCSADTLIREHTNFLYKTAFLLDCQKEVLKEALLSRPSDLNKQLSFGLVAGPCAEFSSGEIRFCDICMSEAETVYGGRYWRRVHQIPLVLVCPDHGCVLRKSISTPASLTRGLHAPTIYHAGSQAPLVFEGFGINHQKFLQALAQDCASLNRGQTSKFLEQGVTQQSLREALVAKGFLAVNHSDRWFRVYDCVSDIISSRAAGDMKWLRLTWPSLFDDDSYPKSWFKRALSITKDRVLPEHFHLAALIVGNLPKYSTRFNIGSI